MGSKRLVCVAFSTFAFMLFLSAINCSDHLQLQGTLHFSRKWQHTLSILAMVKNEAFTIQEWVEHYRWQGVDHFYVTDNNSTDETVNLLQPYRDEGIVTLWQNPAPFSQVSSYRTMYAEARQKSKWFLVVDVDEFLFSTASQINIKDVLGTHRYKQNVSAIYIYWWIFGGAEYEKQPKCLRRHFVWRGPSMSDNKKGVFRSDDMEVSWVGLHTHGDDQPLITSREIHLGPDDAIPLRMNHYPIQSREFFAGKMTRGDAINPAASNARDWKYYAAYDSNKVIADTLLADKLGEDCKPLKIELKR